MGEQLVSVYEYSDSGIYGWWSRSTTGNEQDGFGPVKIYEVPESLIEACERAYETKKDAEEALTDWIDKNAS